MAPAATLVAAPGTFRIATMDCSIEESEIRRVVEPIAGIRGLHFQLGRRLLRIDGSDDALPMALAAIRKAGFVPEAVGAGPLASADALGHGHVPAHDHSREHDQAAVSGTSIYARLAAALGLALAAECVHYFAPDTIAWRVGGMLVAAVAIWLAGIETYTKGLIALRRGRLNINALMSVAVTGAFVIGQWPEAAMVMALYAIAELIEARAVDKARNAIQGLVELAPDDAEVMLDGAWQRRKAAAIGIGTIARVRPGERVALDGTVLKGYGSVDQASVTGESMPVDKGPGLPLFAGTINVDSELEYRVTAAANDTTLARIIHAVEEAQGTRAPTQRFVDRFATIYTPTIFALALAVAVLSPLLLGWPWLEAVYKALVLLVIACPCALVISTPVSVVSGLASAARRGILIKGGTYLETARLIKAVALDKTGTLTEGKPKLVEARAWGGADDAGAWQSLAKSLAARSDHPVSRAIAAGLDVAPAEVDAFKALVGRGVEGVVAGRRLVLGNHRLIKERQQATAALDAELEAHEAQGRTVTLLADEAGVRALFAVADTLKPGSVKAVAQLARMGVTAVMLTGDNPTTAQAVAREAGIADARGGLLPQDKLGAIGEMQKRYGLTAMTGDGINDAPALAQADIGFAMGAAGTDIAVETADVVIMNDNLGRIAETIALSRRTHAILWQNIVIALAIKAVFFVLAVFGSATMWMAVFADMGASLLVVANGLRLMRD
ncbi:heavy metal translocating P-type ATPase [Variovorax humicola]|uniref:P-type Zn(2+) transporter n=2 Tax=Variovorax humicola TaxID=1769758 RepID=A0ABU8VYV6_9BURK